jgi:hypothetical protein
VKKLHRGRLLLSTCLTGIALAAAPGAYAQDNDSNWQPRAEVDARAADGSSQVSFELFAPVAQNDSNLMFVAGRIGTDERYDRNGSVTIGGRGKIGEDVAIGVNAGVDFYKSDLSKRDITAASFGLEAFTSVFDLRLNYRLPVTDRSTIGYLDPNASPAGVLSVENNRLIERKSGWRLEDVPMGGANGEIGATAPLGKHLSVRASAAGFDYRDDAASKAYRGVRGGLELGVEDPLGTGGRFSLGAELQNDNRWGTQARGTVRLSIPLGRGSRDRSAGNTGLDRQMGDRVRRDYVSPSGTRYTDLTSTSFAVDARTGAAFGGVYYVNGAAAAAGAGTSASPTTLGDAVTRAGANGIVVALGNAGNIASGGVTLATNQYLVGGASSVDVRHSNGTVTAFAFGGSNGTIVGNNALGAAVTLGTGSVVRDVTVRGSGSGILANGVGGFSLERVIIENTGGAGLTLTNTIGPVVIDGITVRNGAGAGVVVNGGSNVTLRNSTIGGGAGAIDINDAGGNLTTSLSNLTLSATGGTVLDIDGSGAGTVTVAGLSGIAIAGGNGETGGFAARYVTFDSSTAAGIQAVNAGTMQVGTSLARVGGAGVSLTEVDGALSFGTLNIANNGGTGLTVTNTKSGTFTLTSAAGAVDTTAGTALNLDPLFIDLTFSSVRSVGAAGAGIILSNVQGAGTGGNALTIGTLTITNSGQQGLFITGGSTGLVTIGGGTITNSGGASVQVGQSGVTGSGGTIGLNFGAAISDTGAGPLVSIFNIGGVIRFTGTISGAGPITLGDTLAGSSVTFTGATTITGSTSPALSLNNLAGSTAFTGLLTIANPAGTAIVIGSVPGGVTFGDVDITGLGAATGVNLTGTQGNVTFGTLDITGTGAAGSTGIDLTNASNAGAITITNPSVIQGVDIGVNLTNAHITGSFRYGDANAANGLQSRITANTVIVVAGMNATQGTYNFADVQLDGNTNNITGGSFTAYYVLAGATGAGTALDPGSIAGAAASGAQYIVLLNNPTGGQDVIDTAGLAGGALSLTSGQSLVSFLNTDFFPVTGATVPANLIVSNLGPTGIANTYAGSGAAVLTSSIGASTVNLANDSRVDGVIIHNDALGAGIVGSGVSNVIIRNSNVSGNGGAINIVDGGLAASVTLSNLNLSANSGVALSLSGAGAGTLNVSGTGVNIAATGTARGAVLDDVTVGTLDIGSITTGNAGGIAAVQVTQVAGGTVNIGSVTVGGASAGVGLGVANNSATVNIGAVSTANTAGLGVAVSGNSGNVTLGPVSVTNSGSDGVRVTGNSGTVALGQVTVSGAGGAGLRVSNATGNVTVAGASITGAVNGVEISGVSSNVTVGATSIANSSGTGILVDGVSGSATFGTTTIANSAGIVLGAGSTGTIGFGDVDITGLGAGKTGLDARSGGGTVTFATLDITGASTSGTRGIDLTGASFAGSLIISDSSTITGVGTGLDLTNAHITGSFRYGDGSNTDADGAHSTISAITPIAIGGLNTAVGTYDLSDVALIGDTTGLATNPVTLFFVEAGATGVGTKTDPGSLAAALAASASVIVLLNNPAGGSDVLDVAGLGTFTLDANQRMIGFLNGDTQTVGGGTPANLFLYGITPGIVTNPYAGSGAALLTNTGAGATITLSSGSSLDGLRIGGAGIGVSGIGTANVSIANSVISGGTGALLLRDGGTTASATLTNLALSSTSGTALDLLGTNGGTLTLRGSGISVAATGNARGVAMDSVTLGGNLAFTTVSTLTSAGAGVSLNNVGGAGGLSFTSINVGGTTSLSGVRVTGNSAAINLGNVTVANTASYGIEIGNNPGNVTLGNFNISNTAMGGLLVFGMPGTFTATGGTVTNSGTMGIGIGDVDGSVTFTGAVTITNPGTAGVAFNTGSTGTITFADVDVLGVAANRTGVDARLASGNITFGTLDIIGASATGTRGIDLTGATFSGNLIVSGSSSITGVGTGVDLTNAAITGNFRFGDGSNTDANGAGSTINATVPLVVTGLNALTGTYNFADVNMVGDTSSLATSATTYWVLAGASGAGTRSDPGSLAGAAASGADFIILVNNPAGGADTLDANDPTYGTGGTFTLMTGQQLRGFLNGDTIAVPGGAPANVVLYNIATGVVTNPFSGSGAPTLTTTAGGGADTVVVANNSVIDGVVIANGGTGSGVLGSGVSNVTIRNSMISGADSAIDFSDGGLNASIALSNLHLWSSNGNIALGAYALGGGTTTITQLSNIVIEGGHGEQGGAYFFGTTFDADLATAGFQTVDATLQIGSATTRLDGKGIDLTNSSGALNFSGLSIYNNGGLGLDIASSSANLSSTSGTIDTIDGTALWINGAQADLVLGSVVQTGLGSGVQIANLTGTGPGNRALQIANLNVASASGSGITIGAGVTGNVSFGAASSITDTTGTAISITGATGTVTYLGSVAQSTAGALALDVSGHSAGTLDFSGATFNVTGGTGLAFNDADGTYSFGDVALSGGARIAVLGGSAGNFTFGNVDVTGLAANTTAVDLTGATGNLTFATLDISGASATGTRGIDLTGSTTAGNMIISGSSTITGVGIGVDLTNAAITGNFRYGDGSNVDANGAGSTINATVPLVVAGLNALTGTYNFADVNLIGDTSSLATSATTYWVLAGASGAGTRSDPGSLAGAAASGADIIILVNNPAGGTDTLDANEAVYGTGGTFTLMTGQQLRGFLNGDSITLPGGAPANVVLYNIATGFVTNPFTGSGAPTLTTTAGGGADTLHVANNSVIDGVVIANGGNGTGVYGSGTSNVTIRNSVISGVDSAIDFSDGGLNASIALSNLRVWSSNNSIALAAYRAGAGSTTVTELSNVVVEGGHGEAGGAYFNGATFDADLATAGFQAVNASLQIGTAATRLNGAGVELSNAVGALNFTSLGVYNSGGLGLRVAGSAITVSSTAGTIDTVNGNTLTLTAAQADLVLDSVVHSGTGSGVLVSSLTGTGAGGRALDVANLSVSGATNGIAISGAVTGSFNFGAASSISGATGAAIALGNTSGTLDFTYGGSVTQANNASLLNVVGHTGTVIFGATSNLTATNGTGLQFSNADGTYVFNGTTTLNGGDAGIDILAGSAGSFTFGAATSIASPTGTAFAIADSTAGVTYNGSITQANNAALVSVLNHSGGTIAFQGGTLSAAGGSGLAFDNADGTYSFGNLVLSGGSRLAILNGSAGNFTFGDTDITGLAANTTAADLTGLSGSATFATLDVTGASATGTRGIDLTGNTTAGNVIISGSSTITGVGIGVDLTNAAITGNFRYGDGSNVDANGAASNITAVTPLVIAGLNGGVGTYNFADVNLNGDTTNLSVSAYFVLDGATGTGSRSDPGTLAGAEAASATYIVLLNNPAGGSDLLDATAGAGGSLDLDGGQILLSFRDTDSFNVGGGAPANVVLFNVQTGVIANPFAGSGAPTLTASGANATVTLGGGNVIDGVVIANTGTGAGVLGNGVSGVNTIRNSTISGGAAGAIRFFDGAANTIVALQNLSLAANGGNILNLDGTGAGTLTVSTLSNLTVTHTSETGGFAFDSVAFDSDPTVTPGLQVLFAGALTLGTTGARIAGTAFSLTNVTGTLNFTDLNIANDSGTGLIVANSKANNFVLGTTGGAIDTTNGTAINLDPLTIHMVLGSVYSTGGAYGILLDQVEGDFTVTGSVSVNAATNTSIAIRNNTAQTDALDVHFQGATIFDSTTTTGAGVSLTNNTGATVDFTGSLGIYTSTGTGLATSGGGTISVTGAFNGIYTGNAAALSLSGGTIDAAGMRFAQITAAPAAGTAISASGVTLTGALNIGGLNIDGAGTAVSFNNIVGTGGINLTGTLDLDTTGTGFEFINGVGTVNIANIAGSALTIDGASRGVFLNGMTSGTVNIASAAGSASIGATTSSSTAAIAATGSAGTLNYGGTIGATAGSALSVSNSTANITLAGAITSTSGGTAFNFVNADGTYTISGNVNHAGGAGVALDNATDGSITFSGASKSFNTGTAAAITAAQGTLAFTGGGLGIVTTTGMGLNISGGTTLSVTGAGNTIATSNATAVQLSNATVAAAGVTFDNVTSTSGFGFVLNLNATNLIGAFNLGGLTVNGNAFAGTFSNLTGTGGVNLTGTIDIDGGSGFNFAGSVGTINIANTAGSVLTMDGTGSTISLGMSSGTINIASAGGTASIGGTASPTVAAISSNGSTGGTFNYGGTINVTTGTVLSLLNDASTINLTGAINSTTSGTAFSFNNADGTYLISGAVDHHGGAGLSVNNTSSGTITFSGASKVFSTTGTAIGMQGTGSLSFTGGGLDIDTVSGTGLIATGGTLVITGANNTIITDTGPILNLGNVLAGTGGINFAALTATGTVNNLSAINLSNLGGTTFDGGTVNIAGTTGASSNGIFVQGGSAATIGFGATTIGTTGKHAIELNGANGAVTFGTVSLAGATSDTVLITNATNAVALGAGSIASIGAANYAVAVSGGTGPISVGANLSGTNAVNIVNHETGTVTFSGDMSANTGGISVSNSNSGVINFTGKTLALTSVLLTNNSGGTINFNLAAGGNGLDITPTSLTAFHALGGGTISVTGTGNSIVGTTHTAIDLDTVTIGAGGFNFDSVTTNGATTGISLLSVTSSGGGTIALGTVNLQGIDGRGIDVTTSLAAGLTIQDLDIGLNGGSSVAFDLNGATINAPITVGDFDVTNAGAVGSTIAVDLRGATGGATVRLGDASAPGASSTISNVGTGIYLNAATNLAFTYGDGEAGTDTGSTISATTAINATAAPTVGTYDFRDVTFAGSPGTGFGINSIYFVDSDGATGGGNGSGSDAANPMTLAAAELLAAAQDLIVLVNNGSAISAAGSNGNDSLVLASNVQVRGFGDGVGGGAGSGSAPISLSLTVPSTILFSGGTTINIADPTGNGAATLTSAAGASVVTLGATGNSLAGFILNGNAGSATYGVFSSGGTGVMLNNLTANGFVTAGIGLFSSTNATVNGIRAGNNLGADIAASGSGLTVSNVISTGNTGNALNFNGLSGITTLTNINITGAPRGLLFASVSGTVNATNVDVTGGTLASIAISGGTASYNFDATSSISQASTGAAFSVLGGNSGTVTYLGTINATNGTGLQFDNADGTYNFTGTTTLNGGDAGIDILNGSAGAFTFGTGTSITSSSGTAFNVSGSTAGVVYSGSITQANNAALVSILNHSGGTITFQTGTLSATNGTGLQFNNADGTYNFTGTTTLNGGDAGIDIITGSDGTFGFGTGTTITHAAAGDAFVLTDSNSNLTYSGNISDSNGYAVRIDNHDAGTVTFQTGQITSSGANALGLSVTNSNGGTVNFNSETTLSTQTNNAVTLGTNAGSTIAFNAAGAGLGITTTSGTGFAVSGGGTINVLGSNNTIATGSGVVLNIANATAVATALNLNFASAGNTSGVSGILVNRTAGTLTGTVNIAGGAITATDRGIDLNGDALAFTYGGTITTSGTTARSVEVTGHTANTVTFSGNITDTALGINVSSNTGGTIAFTGQSIALTTVANAAALTLSSNTGATINFAPAGGGNGLDILASGSGAGISFTGGGTLNVTGSGNTVQTATGTILDFQNVSAGTNGIAFDSLSSTGTVAANAININNLDGNALNATTVSIAGTTGATSDGIFYGGGSTTNVSLGTVTIANTGDEGIEINGAGNGTFTASSVTIDNTAGNGVEINGSDNAVTLTSGAIGGTNDPTGYGVYVLNGTGDVTIGASVTKTSAGNVVFVDNHETGTVTLSGNIGATGAVDNGILVQNVNSGSVIFSGTTKTITTGANTGVNLNTNTGGTVSFNNGGLAITTTSGTGFSYTGGGTLNIAGTGNTVQTGTGQILNLVNGNVGASGVTFATLSSTGSVVGTAINISNLDGNVLNTTTVSIAGTTGATADGIFYGGGSTTNVSLVAVTIANTGDEGIEINGAGNGTFSASNLAINNTAGNGVEINGATNSVTLTGGNIGATNDPAGFGVYVLGGTGAISVSSSITKTTAGNVVFVDNHETGNVTFSGNISATGGLANGILVQNVNSGIVTFSGTTKTITTGTNTGVNLNTNTGGTIAFTNGGLAITATSGAGFTATAGGTVTIEGAGNTLSSSTGTPLNIASTTIGANGVTFQSISSNGAASGVILSSTGAAGGLNVTGTGSAGSGGTIQNSVNDGISLSNTENVRLDYMNVTNNLGDGIGGSNVNGFLINHMVITGNGNDAGTDESGINIAELTGSASSGARPTGILNSTISNNNEFEVQITNSTGTLTNFQVTNTTISSNGQPINGNGTSPHGNLFNFLGTGTSSMGITVAGGSFTGDWNPSTPPTTITGSGLFVDSSGTSMTANVSGASFTNNNNGINVSTGPGSTTLTYSINNNTFNGSRSTAINDFQNGNSPFGRTVNGIITNNIIGTNGVALSGSQLGNGISVSNEGSVNANYLITGNTIQQVGQAGVSGSSAIAVNVGLVGQATFGGTTNLTVTNNTIRDILNSRGVVINNNQTTGTLPTIRLSLSGNQFLGTIAGQAGNGQYIRLSDSGLGPFFVTQAAATAGAIANELDDANGFNDTSKISIGTGTITYNSAAPTQPPASVPLP